MTTQLSPEFVSFVAEGGYAVASDVGGVDVWKTGGEIRFLLHEGAGDYIVESAHRAEGYEPEFRSSRLVDAERFLTMRIGGGAVRSALGLGVLRARAELPFSRKFRSVIVRDASVELVSIEEPARRVTFLIGVVGPAALFSHIADIPLDDLRRSLRDRLGAPAYSGIVEQPTAPSASTSVRRVLTEAQVRLVQHGTDLFQSLAAKSGQTLDDPLNAVPFDGGVAVVRAVRGGGKIFVAADGSVLFRGSSYTFERAMEEFLAGERTPLESFRSSTAERGTSVERRGTGR